MTAQLADNRAVVTGVALEGGYAVVTYSRLPRRDDLQALRQAVASRFGDAELSSTGQLNSVRVKTTTTAASEVVQWGQTNLVTADPAP